MMRLDHKLVDVLYMARDFFRILRGTDYFHQPDLLGRYFVDGKSYYIDFRGKAHWIGAYRENVPVLYVPSLSRSLFLPAMILQYGLGSIDMYFETGSRLYLENIRHVASWLFAHQNDHDYFDNLICEITCNQRIEYYSNNSALTQGQAISFLTRAAQYGLLQRHQDDALRLARRLYRNMILPVHQGGVTLYKHGRVYLCEWCRRDDYIVLNGWIFAVFGAYDYSMAFVDAEAQAYLEATVDTLADCIRTFIVPDDSWSRYDNKGRLCSATYQVTHINQAEALFRLTHREAFREAHERLVRGYTRYNRVKYTLRKILEKLRDPVRYSTVR